MRSEPALDLERFAAVSALIDAGRPRDEVLEAASLSRGEWTAIQGAWLGKMAQQARLRRFELQSRFNDLLLGHLEALERGEKVTISEDVRLGRGGGPEVMEPVRAAPSSGSGATSAPAAPPFEAPAPAPSPLAPSPPVAAASGPGPASPPSVPDAPPPAVPDVAPPVPPAAPGASPMSSAARPETEPPPGRSSGTPFRAPDPAEPPSASSSDSALPFAGASRGPRRDDAGRRPPATPFDPAPPAAEPVAESSGTVDLEQLGLDGLAAQQPRVTPFESPAPSDDTGGGGDAALPFRGGRTGKRSASSEDGALPFGRSGEAIAPPPEPEDPLAGTLAVGAADEGPRLTLAQFASLEAELSCYPDRGDDVRARYGMDAASLDDERGRWARRFLDDPSLKHDYERKVEQYRAWLARR